MRRNRPSHTALKVARGLVFVAQDPEAAKLLPKGAAEATERLLVQAGRLPAWELFLYRSRWFRGFVAWLERHIMHGTLLFSMRKRFMEDETRSAVSKGAVQVLSVGAGFDTLCLRLSAELPEVAFVEVDHPATHAPKRSAVERMGAARPNLHLLGADLASTSLGRVLSSSGAWKTDARSVIVAEGVLMYLHESAVRGFLKAAREAAGPGSRLLFTHVMRNESGRIYVGRLGPLTRLLLRLIGEPLHWAPRSRVELKTLLKGCGWRLVEDRELCDLGRRYLGAAGAALARDEIEFMALAEAAP